MPTKPKAKMWPNLFAGALAAAIAVAVIVRVAATPSGAGAAGSASAGPGPVVPPPLARPTSQVERALGRFREGSEAEAPTGASAGEVVSQVSLKGGATMTLPAGATETKVPGGVPGTVGSAHTFKLPGGRRRLLVGQLDIGTQSCPERLEQEYTRMKASRAENDPEKLKLRSMTSVEERTVGGQRTLYTEAMQGTSLADAGVPFAAVASVMLCAQDNMVLLVYVTDEPALDGTVKPMLDAVVTSYAPAKP